MSLASAFCFGPRSLRLDFPAWTWLGEALHRNFPPKTLQVIPKWHEIDTRHKKSWDLNFQPGWTPQFQPLVEPPGWNPTWLQYINSFFINPGNSKFPVRPLEVVEAPRWHGLVPGKSQNGESINLIGLKKGMKNYPFIWGGFPKNWGVGPQNGWWK